MRQTYPRNIAICDDEKKLRCDLRNLIEIHLDLKGLAYQIEEYESGAALMERDKTGPVDILFLDIEMPALGGMETAKALRAAGKTMLIIFVTAYPDYVFQGYEVQAFHYILKPYQETKIKEVLDNALKQLNINQEQYYIVAQKSGTLRLALSQICYFKSDRRMVYAVNRNGQITEFYGKLDDVEHAVPACFQRTHNRYLVNLNDISKLESARCICNGADIPVSRAYKQQLAVAFAQINLI